MPNIHRKGKEFEQAVTRYLKDQGLGARRNGHAGQADGDISVGPWCLEAKNQRNLADAIGEGMRQISGREGRRGLVVKRPYKPLADSLVIVRLEDWARWQVEDSRAPEESN